MSIEAEIAQISRRPCDLQQTHCVSINGLFQKYSALLMVSRIHTVDQRTKQNVTPLLILQISRESTQSSCSVPVYVNVVV